MDDRPPTPSLPGPGTSWRAPSFRLEISPYSNDFSQEILEVIRHHPSIMQDNAVFLGVPRAESVPQDLIELLWEGHIWAPQLDMVGALINAGGSHTHVFSTDEATTLYRTGLEMFTMRMDWEDLDTLLFPIVLQVPEDEDLTLWRLRVADMHHASVTFLEIGGAPSWDPDTRVAAWLQETEKEEYGSGTPHGETPPLRNQERGIR